ncbi:cupin domain-containing protein [Candidatus Bathyarchaeota archaeon]|nr:cupin domain-containing protein [Candidatus Bathyarchaeota archaeon]
MSGSIIKVRKLNEEPGELVNESDSLFVNSVDVVLKRSDFDSFSSRILRIEPGGHTAFHFHLREHIVIVIRGTCRVETDDQTIEVQEAQIVTIPPNVSHRFSNPSNERLALLIMNFFEESKIISPQPLPEVSEK